MGRDDTMIAPRIRCLLLGALLGVGACAGDHARLVEPVPPPRASANTLPTAAFTVSPRWPAPGDTVTFDASWSLDADGTVQQYEWTLGNGATQVTGAQARTVFRSAGSYAVSVTVVDDSGGRSTQSLTLTVSAAGAPATAVDSAQSLVAIASASVVASAATVVTVTARTAAGLPVSGVPVWITGTGVQLRAVQPGSVTSALGVAAGSITSGRAQVASVVAIADYTLLRSAALTIGATNLGVSQSTVRLTEPTVASLLDSTLIEVTARDTIGNPLVGALVSLTVSGGTATVRNTGVTDADGRRVVTLFPTVCGGTALSVQVLVNGTPLQAPLTVTSTAPAVYGTCGIMQWLDAATASTVTSAGGVLTQWSDRAGTGRVAVASAGPTVVANGLNGLTAVRFDGATQFVPLSDVVSGTPYTVFVVERRRANRSANYLLGGSGALALTNLAVGYATNTSGRLTQGTDNLDGAVTGFSSIAAEPARVWSGRWTNGARSLQINAATVATDAASAGITAWAGAALGRATIAGTTSYYVGDVGEVLFFNRALTDAERTTVTRGLMGKWSVGTLAITAGNSQTAAPGSTVGTAPQVRVTDDAGAGLAGATISWQVTAGNGSTSTATSITDANGYATATWTLGTAGTNTLVAWYGPSAGVGQSATFTATASGTCIATTGLCDASLWLDATDATTLTTSSGVLLQWRDKSGFSRHANAVSATAPSVQSNALVLKNMVRFDGTDFMDLANQPWPGNTGSSTIFIVERRRSSASGGYLFGSASSTPALASAIGYKSNTTAAAVSASSEVSGAVSGFSAITTEPTRVWAVRGAPGAWSLLINNANVGSISAFTAPSGTPSLMLGRYVNSYLTGDIGEVLIFSRALSDAERQTMTLYLMGKWGAGTLSIESGNGQTANAGTSPSTAPRVRLSDGNGNGIANVNLAWQVTGGGGRVYNLTTFNGLTDASGYIQIPAGNWVLDNGTNQLSLWQSIIAGQGPSVALTATGQLPMTPTLHLDAQDASTLTVTGSAVSSWRDRGGSGRSVDQATTSLQPSYSTLSINSRPAVVFDATNDVLVGNSVSYGITGARSVFTVVRTTAAVTSGACTDGAGQYLLDRNTANSNPLTSIKAVSGRWVVQTRLDNGGSLGCAPASSGVTITANAATLVELVQSTSSITLFGNGTSIGSLSVSGTNTMQPISVGRHGDQSGSPTLPGAVGEILVFSKDLTATERQIVERYLGWKWGITVP